MTVETAESSQVAERPKCGTCNTFLDLRGGFDGKGNGFTPEQRECGVWYDHPPAQGSLIGHTSSVLLPRKGGPADHASR